MTMVLAPARKTSGGKAAKPAPAKTEYQAPAAQAPVAPVVETPAAPAVVNEAPAPVAASSSSDAKATEAPASAAVVEAPVVIELKVEEVQTESARQVHSSAELFDMLQGTESDAPLCFSCGIKMRPSGSCHVCEGCGSTSGCS
jgi:ribonucleoside-diphosphate reductase alpha chain